MKHPSNFQKINDPSNSPLKRKFDRKEFVAETNLAVAMGRVSTKRNKEKGNSDAAQREDLQKYADEQRLEVVRWWDVAETASKHDDRKNFLEMIEYVEESQKTDRPIKHVMFAYTSRGARNKKSKRLIEELLDLGVAVHFPKDHLVLTSASDMADWLQWHVKSIQDEQYIERLRSHIWDGMVKKVESGWYPGRPPIGYKNYRDQSGLSTNIVDEETAPYVIRVFELWATGQYSIGALVQELNREFPQSCFKGRRASEKYMEKLLRKRFYYGEFEWAGEKHKGLYTPLITSDLWERAQKAFKIRGWDKKCVKESDEYGRLIKCDGRILDTNGNETEEVCGCALTPSRPKKRHKNGTIKVHELWGCSNTTRPCSHRNARYMKSIGKRRYIKQSDLEDAMTCQIFGPLSFPSETAEWMKKVLLEQHQTASKDQEAKLKALQDRIRMLNNYIDRAYGDRINGTLPDDIWRPRNDQWVKELRSTTREVDALGEEKQDYIDTGVLLIELCQRAVITFKNTDRATKRKMVDIVSSNLFLREGRLRFDYKKPFDILADPGKDENWWT